jgi:FMN phosphatase YigB (HAD superfamily)/sugar phosphate isomerase/epimerase
MTRQIDAVLFDMGGTLRGTRKRSREERLAYTGGILKLLGSSADPADFSCLLARRQTAYRNWARETMIELNEADLWSRWMLPDWPEGLVREHAVQLNLLWRDATGERVLFPEASEVIIELFRRGYRLGVVSNTTSSTEAPEALKKHGLTSYFETIILSAVVGKRKPDPDILLEATHRMEIKPVQCAYIGDLPHRDVAAARKAGFSKTILIRHRSSRSVIPVVDPKLEPDHRIADLRELLVLFPVRTPPKPTKVYKASLSTMWGMKNFANLGDFMEAGRRIGFEKIELNHQVDSFMLEGTHLNGHQFSSVHEPCPADISVGTLKKRDWLISALDEECRREGVKSVQRSIDLAHRLGATTVVVHAGTVDMDRTLENRMRSLFESGQSTSREYREVKDLLVTRRKELAPPRLEAVKKSLVELLDYADQYKVRLGIENRYYYLEFPSTDELGGLLDLADPTRLGFIYDVGHAQALSRLGFFPHDEWLARFAPRIIGTHLHDVSGIRDHLAAGLGDVDFDLIARFLPDKAFRTCEFLGSNAPEQVKNGLMFLQQHGCINC